MRRVALALLLIVGLATPATGVAESDGNGAARTPEYALGAGDRVKVTVFGERDLSGTFEIGGDGIMAFPLIGKVQAGGLTPRALEGEITARLKDGYLKKPQVSAEVVNYRPFYILGEVKQPGSYPYVSGMTVITAVALGGGFTNRARKASFYITRASDPEGAKRAVGTDAVVLPGDIVRVRERFF